MKIQRHAAILRVVRERRIESQDELREALSAEGFVVTQATLSRDIRELGLAKLSDPKGGAYYAHPHRAALRRQSRCAIRRFSMTALSPTSTGRASGTGHARKWSSSLPGKT